jgi:hypothetical protein
LLACVADAIVDLVLQLPEVVEDEGGAPLELDFQVVGHAVGFFDPQRSPQFPSLDIEPLHTFHDRLAQREAIVGVDPHAGAHRLDPRVGARIELEVLAVFPHKTEDLVGIALERLEVHSFGAELFCDFLPHAGDLVRVGRCGNPVGFEIRSKRLAETVTAVVGVDLRVRREHRAQIIGEREMDRRAVVETPNRHC